MEGGILRAVFNALDAGQKEGGRESSGESHRQSV